MKKVAHGFLVLGIAAMSAGCVSVPIALAPGAEELHVTKNSADVVACTPVGNVDAHQFPLDPSNAMRQMRNESIGLGANTLFITFDPTDHVINHPDAFATGVAYRCVNLAAPAH